jgi:hypothetical protein
MLRVIGRPKGLTLEGHKNAILIGINYNGGAEEMRLTFPIRDIKEVARLLKGGVSFRGLEGFVADFNHIPHCQSHLGFRMRI